MAHKDFAESYYCSGTNCRGTKNPAGEGFCSMNPFWCEKVTGLGGGSTQNTNPTLQPQEKYCSSSGCTKVPMDYQRMGDNDRCTKTMTTCLFASKHNNAGGGFRLCNHAANLTL